MDPVRWRVELTREQMPRLVQRMEWVLQHKNQRLAERMQGREMTDATRTAGLVVSILGLLLTFAVHPFWWWALVLFFALTLAMSLFPQRFKRASRRFAGRMIAKRATRLLRSLEHRLPLVFEYELQADCVGVRCEAEPHVRPMPLAPGLVVAADDLVVVFRRGRSLNPRRKLHVPDVNARRAVLQAFARHGAECVEVSGPAEGYADALPAARLH
jgi:hypothetical protein